MVPPLSVSVDHPAALMLMGLLETDAVRGPGLDTLARDALLPVPEPRDLVAVLDVGAYGYTESMPLFLSHPIPAEVAVRGGRAELIRPRVEPSTWIDTQLLPDW